MGKKTGLQLALLVVMASASDVRAHAQAPDAHTQAPDDALTAQVEAQLTSGIEATGAEAAIAALGEAGERALRAVFERAAAPYYVRLRALSAMQVFTTEATARYFETLVRASQHPAEGADRWGELHPARSALVLRRALEGLIAAGALLQPQLDLAAVTSCLTHGDAHVRRTAADLLATVEARGSARERKLEGGMVEQALTKQLVRERSRMVRGRLERALTSRSVRPEVPR